MIRIQYWRLTPASNFWSIIQQLDKVEPDHFKTFFLNILS
jgi:hypothetical protein